MTTEAQSIIEAGRLSTTPHKVEPGCLYVVQGASGYQTIDLTGDKYRPLPKRKTGNVTVDDVASFAQYYLKHCDDVNSASEVFADTERATVTAVLNAHGSEEADWQDHRVVLKMRQTDQWKAWTERDRKLMTQQQFAEFVEDHAADIAPGAKVTAADLLEIAQSFHAHTKVTFASGKRLASGETEFAYVEETTANAGRKGAIAIPGEFELALKPFEDCAGYRVRARFRYRLNDGVLALGYHLDDPAATFRAAVGEVIEATEEACTIKIMRGQPS